MNNFVFQIFHWFYNSIIWCYPVVLLLFFLWIFSKKDWKNETVNILFVVNALLVLAAFVAVLFIGIELFQSYNSALEYEWFSYSRVVSSKAYFTITISIYLMAFLFLFRKIRKSWGYSLFFLLLLNWEMIIFEITKRYRDYLPSAWTVEYPMHVQEGLIYVTVFTIGVIIVYIIFHLRNSLPNNSTFLRPNTRS